MSSEDFSADREAPPPLPNDTPEEPTPANLFFRGLALLLDTLLIGFAVAFILRSFILPNEFPDGMREFGVWLEKVAAEAERAQANGVMPERIHAPSSVAAMIDYSHWLAIVLFWLYFFASETFMRGASLGKRIFRIQVIQVNALRPPPFLDSALRSMFKAVSVLSFLFLPSLAISVINFSIPFFNSRRLAGHDFLCRTRVVEEVELEDPEESEEDES